MIILELLLREVYFTHGSTITYNIYIDVTNGTTMGGEVLEMYPK